MLDWLIDFTNTYLVVFLLNIILAAVVLLVGLKLVKVLSSQLKKRTFFQNIDTNIGTLILNSMKIILNGLIIIISIQIIGVPSATIIAVLGSCGLAIGLALQGGLSNLAGGVMLMIFKPFHAGDYICTEQGDGTVDDIGVFYTKLVTKDNRSINIPNSILSSTTVTNMSVNDKMTISVEFSVAYGSDIDLAKKVLLACAEVNSLVLDDPAPSVYVSAHDDSSIKLTLRVGVNNENYWKARWELLEDSIKAFKKADIEIPFPQMDVHMKQ